MQREIPKQKMSRQIKVFFKTCKFMLNLIGECHKVYDEVGEFVEKYVPQIMKFYKPAPQWFEWYEIKEDV